MSQATDLNILGVIPARGGSKGIPRKNLLTLGGKTLLELAIESAYSSRLLSRVIVSTEDEELYEVSKAAGADTPFIRPTHLASDTASTWSVMKHAVSWLKEHEGWHTDILVMLQPTTPFRKGTHIDQTIEMVLDSTAESAMTIREVDYPSHWMLRLQSDGRVSRLIHSDREYTRRQDVPKAFQPNGLVYVIRGSALDNGSGLPGNSTRGLMMSFEDSVNIDEWWHYRLAQLIWAERNGNQYSDRNIHEIKNQQLA
jgi:CMP-N-acetylneuraminic acid synthetase